MQALNESYSAEKIRQLSKQGALLVFKHSTRCNISSVALARIENNLPDLEKHFQVFYLDLLRFRSLSNQLALEFEVEHASPQVLLISGGKCLYHASHMAIKPSEIISRLSAFSRN